MRQVMVRGLKRLDQRFVLSVVAYNLVRMHVGTDPSAVAGIAEMKAETGLQPVRNSMQGPAASGL
ncbi:hypothetical protein EV147_3976 [Cupriavidus agavae]|uniref:Transposase n=1 Tax=Cupriavidus agavae TaxID=1001822 RepID=A0A4Q7RSD6_9BURK|nr:hypothetical protein EV147_3976 [Cupriavidus agavae]